MLYRMTSGRYARYENGVRKVYTRNSIVDLDDKEAHRMRYIIQPHNPDDPVEPEDVSIPAPATTGAAQLKTVISQTEDVGALYTIRDEEVQGRNRQSVLKALDERLDSLDSLEGVEAVEVEDVGDGTEE